MGRPPVRRRPPPRPPPVTSPAASDSATPALPTAPTPAVTKPRPTTDSAVTAMLEARSVALVGASPRPGRLGMRMITELARSPAHPRTYLVNPRYDDIGGQPCHRRLDDLPE